MPLTSRPSQNTTTENILPKFLNHCHRSTPRRKDVGDSSNPSFKNKDMLSHDLLPYETDSSITHLLGWMAKAVGSFGHDFYLDQTTLNLEGAAGEGWISG